MLRIKFTKFTYNYILLKSFKKLEKILYLKALQKLVPSFNLILEAGKALALITILL